MRRLRKRYAFLAGILALLAAVVVLRERPPSRPDTIAREEPLPLDRKEEFLPLEVRAPKVGPTRIDPVPPAAEPRREQERPARDDAVEVVEWADPVPSERAEKKIETATATVTVSLDPVVRDRPETDEAVPRSSIGATPIAQDDDAPAPREVREDPPPRGLETEELAFGAIIRRQIPRSGFRTARASHVEPPPGDPPVDSFEVRRIVLSDFPTAGTTHRRIHERNEQARAAARSSILGATGPVLPSPLWDEMSLRLSSTHNRPRNGIATHDGRYDLNLVRLHPTGRFDLGAQVGDRNSDVYLARGYLGFESRTGWLAAVGDQTVAHGGPGLHGTTVRGARVEHVRHGIGSRNVWKAGLMAGGTAVQHANLVNGSFPRRLESAYLEVGQIRRQALEGVAYHFSEQGAGSSPAPDGFESGSGIGLAGSFRRTGLDVRGEFAGSTAHPGAGGEQRGRTAGIRGRGDLGRVTLSGRFQETGGAAYEVGPLGALQSTPRRIEDADLSVRPGAGTGLSLWSGRWSYPPSVLVDSSGSNAAKHSIRGNRWGGRLSWRSPRNGTGLSGSREYRWRSLEHGSDEVVTLNASVSQRFRKSLNTSLAWNRLDYAGRSPHNYLTGSMSMRTGRSSTLTLQQRTLWQEPLGLRLESIADLSSIRALAGRLLVSVQLALRHEEQEDGHFRRAQTQGRVSGDYRLWPNVRLSGRYQLSHSPSGDVHSIEFGLSHHLGHAREAFPGSGLDTALERQIVTGRVFEDRNQDGEWQRDEPGVPGAEVAIDGDAREPVVTDLQGVYRAFLPLGQHTVRLLPASVPTDYSLGAAGPIALDVMPGRTVGFDFPLERRVGSVEGFVLDDRSGSGMRDVKVFLGDRAFTYTDSTGAYRFDALPTGRYEVRLDVESLPFGYRPVGPKALPVRLVESGEVQRCIFRAARPVNVIEF